jgi:glycosyltransferase involved in cell wall biosynthesis
MSAPSVTVIVPFLNAEATIGALLRGLATQQTGGLADVEFVFVDNGSTDRGPRIVSAADLPNASIVNEGTPGVSAARNRGMAVARNDVLALVDSDCVPSRHWLRELVMPFSNPTVQLTAGALASFPPRTAAQRFAARYGMNDAERPLHMALPFANGRNMAVRRSTAEAVGGWPEDMLSGDDIEFSTRVVDHFRCDITYCALALVYHQDRELDEDLWKQARSYGRGIAMLYARHPERLRWGSAERIARARMAVRRRLSAGWSNVARRIGLVTADDAEFARYLDGWDKSFWAGFGEERRRLNGRVLR